MWLFVALALAYGVLVTLVATSPSRLVYDEPYHLATVELVPELGWRRAMRETPSAAGPLLPFTHFLLAPVTGLKAIPLRFVNLLFVALAVAAMIGIARVLDLQNPVLCGLALLIVPFLWPIFGMALTEVLSLCCLLGYCWAALQYLKRLEEGREVAWGLGSGLMLSLACLTRQSNLVVLAGLAALPIRGASFRFAIAAAALPIAAVAWLFYMWGGLVPPSNAHVSAGLKIEHLILSISYLGAATLFISPRALIESSIAIYAALAAAFVSLFIPVISIVPAKGVAGRFLPESMMPAYEQGAAACLVGLGVLFVASLAVGGWLDRKHPSRLFLRLVVAAIAATPILISHLFSSRYVTATIPFLLLLLWPHIKIGPFFLLRAVAGTTIGALMLVSYYR